MKRFRIDYVDPEDRAAKSKFVYFSDDAGIPAVVWAEDYAYTISDKGYYQVTEVAMHGAR